MIQDGDQYNNTVISAATSAPGTALGALSPDDLRRGALNADHVPALWDGPTVFPNGLTKGLALNADYDQYDNTLAGAVGSVDLQAFDTTLPEPPYGPCAPLANEGWRIPADSVARSADACELTYNNGAAATLADNDLQGVFLYGSAEMGGGASGFTYVAYEDPYVFHVAIGFEDSNGDRYIFPKSIRPYPKNACCRGVASTGVYVTQTMLDALGGADTHVRAFFLAVANRLRNSTDTNTQWVGSCYITAWPIRAGTL